MIKRKSILAAFILAALTIGVGVWFFPRNEIPQFVLLTFDSGYELDFWEDTLSFAKSEKIQFTYFLSGAYYVPRGTYGVEKSNIGFGAKDNIPQRIALTKRAKSDGHELASHGMTHFNGLKYTDKEWSNEFRLNHIVMKDVVFPETDGLRFAGYRAPYLVWNPELFNVEAQEGMQYDSSQTWKLACVGLWPSEVAKGVLGFTGLQWPDNQGKLKTTMDFRSYFADGETEDTAGVRKLTLGMYLTLFEKLYSTTRAPMVLITHFGASRMNQSAYYLAMKDFAKEVCAKKNVRCTTMSSAVEWIRENLSTYDSFAKGTPAECAL